MYGDYNDEEERRRQAMLGGGDSDAVTAALRRMSSYKPDPRDEELRRGWQQQEADSLRRSSGASDDYSLGKAARDFAPSLLGIVADIATNKGRGIGGIAQQTAANAAQNAILDREKLADDREFALKQREQRERGQGAEFDRAYKTASALSERDRIKIALQNLGAREEGLAQGAVRTGIAADKASYDRGVDDPRRAAIVQSLVASGVDPKSLEGIPISGLTAIKTATDQQLKHAAAPQVAQDAAMQSGLTSGASTAARIGAESDLADVSAGTAAKVSSARESAGTRARIGTEAELAGTSSETKRRESQGSTTGRLQGEEDIARGQYMEPIARAVVDPGRVDKLSRNPKASAVASEQLSNTGNMLDTVDQMLSIRQREAQGLIKPGEARSEFDALRGRLEGAMSMANAMGTLQEGDRRAIGAYLGSANASWLDIASWVTGGDIKAEQLTGLRNALEAADRQTAQRWGYGEYGTAPIGAAGSSQQAPGAALERLPVPRAPAPPIPASSPPQASAPQGGGSGMVTVRLGGEARQVPADLAQRLQSMDPNVEIVQ